MGLFSKKRAYLDWAAAAPVSDAAARAYMRARKAYGNPSSPHAEGRAAKDILEAARTKIARLMEVKADDVVFTSGATEANALAIVGHACSLIRSGRKPESIRFLYLPSSHASIAGTMQILRDEWIRVEELPVRNGRIEIEALAPMLTQEASLISMDAVCGETGTVWNTREVAEACKGTRTLLHVDATQAPLTQKFSRAHFNADIVTLDASKVGGMRGIGALIAHRTLPLSAVMSGGGQERGLRPGTESPALAASFAAALEEAKEGREAFGGRALRAKQDLISEIRGIPGLVMNTGAATVPNILNVSLPGRDTDYLIALLDHAGFAVSTRSACETNSTEGSRAVFVLTGDTERAKSTLRVSWGPSTSDPELRRFAGALREAVRFLDAAKSAIL
ncbi:MAG: aminotransferase class V-fold PLP-dependent enzyme [bacterium]